MNLQSWGFNTTGTYFIPAAQGSIRISCMNYSLVHWARAQITQRYLCAKINYMLFILFCLCTSNYRKFCLSPFREQNDNYSTKYYPSPTYVSTYLSLQLKFFSFPFGAFISIFMAFDANPIKPLFIRTLPSYVVIDVISESGSNIDKLGNQISVYVFRRIVSFWGYKKARFPMLLKWVQKLFLSLE